MAIQWPSTFVRGFDLFAIYYLAPQEERVFGWNNVINGDRAVIVMAATPTNPKNPYPPAPGFDYSIEVEITRLWRRTRRVNGILHWDVLGVVKSLIPLGGFNIDCAVQMVTFEQAG